MIPRMGRVLLEASGRAAGTGLMAAALVLWMVCRAGGGNVGATPLMTAQEASTHYIKTYTFWLEQFLEPSWGVSWSGLPMLEQVGLAWHSLLLLLGVLFFAVLIAFLGVWLEGMDRGRESRVGGGMGVILLAPPALWAAALTVTFNAVILALVLNHLELDARAWYLPRSLPWVRNSAALLVLSFGTGTVTSVYRGLRSDLLEVRARDFFLVARANGLPLRAKQVRNIALPFLTRLAGMLPMLLGEVIVVEYVFQLEGMGRTLAHLVEIRDGHALMTFTFLLVMITAGVRGLVGIVGAWVRPVVREAGA